MATMWDLFDRETMRWDSALRPGSILKAGESAAIFVGDDMIEFPQGTLAEVGEVRDDGSLWVYLLTKNGQHVQRARVNPAGQMMPRAFELAILQAVNWTHEGYVVEVSTGPAGHPRDEHGDLPCAGDSHVWLTTAQPGQPAILRGQRCRCGQVVFGQVTTT